MTAPGTKLLKIEWEEYQECEILEKDIRNHIEKHKEEITKSAYGIRKFIGRSVLEIIYQALASNRRNKNVTKSVKKALDQAR